MLSYMPQMAGTTVQSFLSTAVGVAVAVAVALVSGAAFARRSAQSIDTFWDELTRITIRKLSRKSRRPQVPTYDSYISEGLRVIWNHKPSPLYSKCPSGEPSRL
jgi:hypothetical protein